MGASIRAAALPALLLLLGASVPGARLFGDETKAELFEFGFDMGRPGTLNIPDGAVLGGTGQIMANIRQYLGSAVQRGATLDIPVASLQQLLRDAPALTRAQYEDFGPQSPGRKRLVMDEHQAVIQERWDNEGARIYAIGAWTAGAIDLCASNRGLGRDVRPGAHGLLQRNTGWMQQVAPVLGLSTGQIDELVRNLSAGAGFGYAEGVLNNIRNSWVAELRQQQALETQGAGGVTALTAANWGDVIGNSSVPVVVVFGQTWNPQTARQVKIIEAMAGRLGGRARFATVDLGASPDLARRERIDAIPTVRVYRDGQNVASQGGLQTEQSIEQMLNAGSGGGGVNLLGIESEGSVGPN